MPRTIEEIRYEGYGPGGVALIVEALTDNRNRTGSDMRAAFSKYGGAWASPTRSPSCSTASASSPIRKGLVSDDAMLEAAIDAGAEECVSSEEGHEFIATLEDFGSVRDALEAKLGEPQSARIEWRSKTMTAVGDDAGETLVKLLDVLDEHDDVQNVYGNYELSDTLMEKLGA